MDDRIENIIAKGLQQYHKIFLRKKGEGNKSNKRKILIVSLGKLGDMVCNIPFIRELKRSFPQAELTLLCAPLVRNYVEYMPYVDRFVYYQQPSTGRHLFERRLMAAYHFASESFGSDYFDMTILPRYIALPRDLSLAHFIASSKLVYYYQQDNKVRLAHTPFECPIEINSHTVTQGLNIVEALGGTVANDELEFWLTEADEAKADELLREHKVDGDRLKVVVLLSISAKQRDWPVSKFAAVCRKIQDKYDAQIVLLGAKNDTEAYAREFEGMVDNVVNLVGKTTVRQTIAVMKRMNFYLGGDTGTLHLAAACKLPGVVVVKDYKGANPLFGEPMINFYPWKADIHIVRPEKPLPGCEIVCNGHLEPHCITQVHADSVWRELDALIGRYRGKSK